MVTFHRFIITEKTDEANAPVPTDTFHFHPNRTDAFQARNLVHPRTFFKKNEKQENIFLNTKGGTLKTLEPETSSSHENKVHTYEQHSILRYVYFMSRIQPNNPNSIQPNRDLIQEPSKETPNPIANYTVTTKVMLIRTLHSSTTKRAENTVAGLHQSPLGVRAHADAGGAIGCATSGFTRL
jgi:hypothetical protein